MYTADHVVILSMSTRTKWTGVRRLINRTTSYLPYDPKCMIFHNRRTTDASEESLLHSTLEAENSNFGRWLRLVFRYRTLRRDGFRLTSSISTGTSRTHNQGVIVLMERVSTIRDQVTEVLLTISSYPLQTRNPAGGERALRPSSRSQS